LGGFSEKTAYLLMRIVAALLRVEQLILAKYAVFSQNPSLRIFGIHKWRMMHIWWSGAKGDLMLLTTDQGIPALLMVALLQCLDH
jgi:hypothetical protein